ncbi:MAG: DUF1207 domain-containing protein [Longimicrobiales bacterium]|nr:DUF1207 domain-containing protein [Longimicrobiales bacterium]
MNPDMPPIPTGPPPPCRGGGATAGRITTAGLAVGPAGLVCALVCATVAALVAPGPAPAQVPEWLFPDRALLPELMAGPRDPVTAGQLVYSWENPTAFGPGVSGEVAISGGVPVIRLAGSGERDALVVGLEGAAFARFSFQVVTRELVNTDWIFAVPLVWHRGDHWLRLRYYHTSSHLGDEYQRRFGPSSINFSRDGADLTAYLRPGARVAERIGLAVYGLVFYSVNSHPEERGLWEARAGVELDPSDGGLWQPFLTADVHVEEGTGWYPRVTLQAGIWLPEVSQRPVRLALELITGPSPMGQFRDGDAGRIAARLAWSP